MTLLESRPDPTSARESMRVASGISPQSPLDEIPSGSKVLLVSSTGGHLAELAALSDRLRASEDSLWVTFETDQSVGLLERNRTFFVDYVAPRDFGAAFRAAARVAPLLRREKFDACLSTGAAVAGTVLPMAALAGIPTYYVESLARPQGPSFTGKLLARAPGVRTLTQYREWADVRWPYSPGILDEWLPVDGPAVGGPLKVLVTLGTIAPYRFDRAVDAVLSMLTEGDEVVWQLGATMRTDLPGRSVAQVSPQEMEALSLAADVVVSHAGVGSILQQFGLGKSPVIATRSSAFNEHVDDHQLGLARSTVERRLTTVLDLDRPSRQTLEIAAGRGIASRQRSPQVSAA